MPTKRIIPTLHYASRSAAAWRVGQRVMQGVLAVGIVVVAAGCSHLGLPSGGLFGSNDVVLPNNEHGDTPQATDAPQQTADTHSDTSPATGAPKTDNQPDPNADRRPDVAGDPALPADDSPAEALAGDNSSPAEQWPEARDGLRRALESHINALDLGAAWRLTLLNDPTYQAALSERAAAQTERAQGRAALLPQVQASYYRGRVRGSRYLPDAQGRHVESDLSYDSTNASIQLQQPLLNYGSIAEYRRGGAEADEGAALFHVKRNEIAVQMASIYLRALLAQGRVDLQHALVDSLEAHVQALEAYVEQDEGTRTDVQETQARLALARADTFSAEDELVVALRELSLMIGRTPDALAVLQADFKLRELQPDKVVEWLDHARQRSPEIDLARKQLVLAETHVDSATAQFLPNLDLVASVTHADSEELTTLSQKSNRYIVGLQLNVPIFAGGYNSAERAHAGARRRVSERELEAVIEKVQADVIREFTQIDGGGDRIVALEAAEASAALSLEAASKSFEYGISSNLDVLKAQDTLHQVRHELLTARLDYVIARVRLAASADIIDDAMFDALSRAFLNTSLAPQQ